jgi:hypothetical protein
MFSAIPSNTEDFGTMLLQRESDICTQTDGEIAMKANAWYEFSGMRLADWRWAAQLGYWNPETRRWNESMGGIKAYIDQREKRRSKRQSRQPRNPKGRPSNEASADAVSTRFDTGSEIHTSGDTFVRTDISCPTSRRPPAENAKDSENGSSLSKFMAKHGWGVHAVRRYWNYGYQAKSIVKIFNGLPLSLRSAMELVLDACQVCADCQVHSGATGFAATPRTSQPENSESTVSEWEQDNIHAYIERRFDADAQLCVGAAANSRAAALLGMRREDLLARLERDDVPLPLPPLDAVAVFLHALGTSRDAVATRYFRLVPPAESSSHAEHRAAGSEGPGPDNPPAVLVCSTSAKRFDKDGRVVKVRQRPGPGGVESHWNESRQEREKRGSWVGLGMGKGGGHSTPS